MHCSEVKYRLTGSRRNESEATTDRALLEHIKACPNCSKEVWAADLLHKFLDAASENESSDLMSFSAVKKEVEEKLAHTGKQNRFVTYGKDILRSHPRYRPVYIFGIATMVVILGILALVPFNYHRTVGYEVAFGGVNKELVEDDHHLCDILFSLGLVEADVDVLGCDTTCDIQIIYLKSREEVDLIVSALARLSSNSLSTDVIPVRIGQSGSLIERVSESIL